MKTLITAWQLWRWISKQRKAIETNAEAYFSDKNALALRLKLERLFKALEKGDLQHVPKPVQWLLGQTEVDNCIGAFGQMVLKSTKLWEDDPVLTEYCDGK